MCWRWQLFVLLLGFEDIEEQEQEQRQRQGERRLEEDTIYQQKVYFPRFS